MFLALLFQFSALAACVLFFLSELHPLIGFFECISLAFPISIVLSSWAAIVISFIFGTLNLLVVLVAISLFIGAGYFYYVRVIPKIPKLKFAFRDDFNTFKWFLVYLALASFPLGYLVHTHFLRETKEGNLFSSGSTWGDLPFHLNIVSSLVYGPNKNLRFGSWESLIYSGSKLVYPIIPDYHSAVLVVAGATLRQSFTVPSMLLFWSTLSSLFFFTYRFTRSKLAGCIACLLSLLSGGTAFYSDGFWGEWRRSGQSIGNFLSQQPYNFVHRRRTQPDAFWFQTLTDMLLPQRSALLAYPICLSAMTLLWLGLSPDFGGLPFIRGKSHPMPSPRRPFAVAGVLVSVLPYCQGHAFVAMGFLAGGLAIMFLDYPAFFKTLPQQIRDWLFFFGPMIGIGLPQLLMLSGRAKEWGFVQFKPMWTGSDPFTLWWHALGLFVPLSIAAAYVLDNRQKRYYAACWVVFLFSNLLQFQPWKLDNVKLIQLWHFAACGVIGLVLTRWLLGPDKHWLKPIALLLVFMLIFSGALCVWKEWHLNWQMYNANDMALANYMKDHTPRDAIVLCSDKHNHPVTTLAGRPIVMGYRGWLSSHGYAYRDREAAVVYILRGQGDVFEMLRQHQVQYVVFGERERREFHGNEQWFKDRSDNFAPVFAAGEWNVYKVHV